MLCESVFLGFCRVRPVGSSSDTDALDFDRMKQVRCPAVSQGHIRFVNLKTYYTWND